MAKLMKKLFAFLTIVSILASCTGSGGYLTLAEEFVDELNWYYDTTYGSEFILVKEHGEEAYDYAVIYDEWEGEYSAWNLSFYYRGMSMDEYFYYAGSDDIIMGLDPLGGNRYYSWEYDVIFEKTEGESKDLEKVSAFIEEKRIAKMGEKLAAEFGLSEERSIEIAKLTRQWTDLKKKRSLTDADAHAFSEKLFGFDLNKASAAYKKSLEGDKADLDALFDQAAEVNGTSPERVNQIFNKLIINN